MPLTQPSANSLQPSANQRIDRQLLQRLQHARADQLILQMQFHALMQKAAKVGAALALPSFTSELGDRRAQHLKGGGARSGLHLNAAGALVLRAHQAVTVAVEPCRAAVQRGVAVEA